MPDVIPSSFGGTLADDGPHVCDISHKQNIEVILHNSSGQVIDMVEFAEAGGSITWEADPSNPVNVILEDTFSDNNTYYHPGIKGYKVVLNPDISYTGVNRFKLTATITPPERETVTISRVIIFKVDLTTTSTDWPNDVEIAYSIEERTTPLPDPV